MLANQPDLLISAAAGPASAIEGNAAKIFITWTVQNQGSAAATGRWSDAVYLSASGSIDGGSIRIDTLDETFQGPLAAGASYAVTRVVTVPAALPGAQFLVVRTDDGQSLDESNPANNDYPLPITLNSPAVDMAVTGATAPSSAVAGNGHTIAVSWTVQNQGTETAAAHANDAVYLSDSPTFDLQTARFLDSRSAADQAPLAAGASYTVHRAFTVPDIAPGAHYLHFIANASGAQGEQAGADANNVFSLPITIASPGAIDLAVTAAASPGAAVAGNGQAINVSYTVQNLGSTAAASAWTDAIYLSDQPTFSASAIALGYYPGNSKVPLAAGSSYTASQSITLPPHAAGSAYLLFRTDRDGVQSETNETNNVYALPITLTAPDVDLAVTAAAAPATAVVGNNFQIAVNYTVTNRGSDRAAGYRRDAIYVSNHPTLDSSAELVDMLYSDGADIPGSLDAGASYTVHDSIALGDTAIGARYLLVVTNVGAGASSSQAETNAANNVYALPIALSASGVDLAISNPSAPAVVEAGNGQWITVSWRVTNQGSSADGYWYDDVAVSDDAHYDVGDASLSGAYANYHYQLTAGASYVVGKTIAAPNVAPGSKQLVFVTDSRDFQGESQETNNVISLPITFTQADVDLTVTGAAAPSTATAGALISVSWTVANQGGETAAGGWGDEVYLSDVPTWDSNAVFLDSFFGPASLAAGASYSPSQTIALPGSASGNKYLLFVTNRDRTQGETNYANGVYAVPISLSAPDLKATSLAGPSSAILGDQVQLSWSVVNQGTVTAPGGWTDVIYLSDTPEGNPFGVGDTVVGTFTHDDSLAPGASYTQQQTFTLPASGLGARYLVVVANANGDVGDADATNNRFAFPITLSAPDLTLLSASAPASVVANDTIQVSWTVQNQGSVSAPRGWTDAVYLSSRPVLDATATYVGAFSQAAHAGLAAGASYSESQSITLPAFAVGNQYLLFVTNQYYVQPESDNLGGGIYGAPGSNNVFAVPITLSAPDLAVSAATAPSSAVVGNGESIPINYTVMNQGSVPAKGTWYDELYVSDRPTFDSTARYLSSLQYHSGTLAAGASYSVAANVVVPNTLSGARYLLIVANSAGNQGESDAAEGLGANNVFALPIALSQPDVDLAVTGATAPASAVAGDSFDVSFTVENQGTDAAAADWTDYVYYSTSPILDSNAVYLGQFSAAQTPLAPGASYTQNQSVTLSDAPVGAGYLFFVANGNLSQSETDPEVNNVVVLPITVAAPDLAVTAASAPATATVGDNQQISVSYTVQNVGAVPAHAGWFDALYVSDKPALDDAAEYVAELEQNPPALGPGSSYSGSFNVSLPATAPGARYLLFVTNAGLASSSGQPESDGQTGFGANNVYAVPITLVAPQVDLAVSNVSAPASLTAGDSVPVSFDVTNHGADAAGADWSDGIYFSTSATFDPNHATLLESFPAGQSPLAAGASYSVNQTLSIPSLPLGAGYLFFVTNLYGDQAETDGGAGNVVSIPVTVGAPNLSVTAASAPGSANTGDSISVSWSVANQGSFPAPASWTDAIYLSTKPTFDSSAKFVGTFGEGAHAGLAAGASYSDSQTVFLPSNGPTGSVYLLIVTNLYAQQPESDGGSYFSPGANNVYALPITIGAPDLAVTAASAPASAVVGNDNSIAVSYTVENQGVAATSGFWSDNLYVSDKPTFDASAKYVTTLRSTFSPLAAGSSYTQSVNATLPALPAGNFYLLFVANPLASISESDAAGSVGANNVYAVPISLTAPDVDLIPSNPAAPASATLGESVPVSFTVTNNGGESAGAFWTDAVYYSADSTFDSSDVSLDFFYPSQIPLGAGASYANSGDVSLPASLPRGAGYLLFVANADNNQGESNATNNVVSLPITLTAADLAVTAVTAPATATLDGTITVSWTVANQGSVAAGANWFDAVYISSQPDWHFGIQIAAFDESSQSGVAPGAGYSDSRSITIPSYVRTGDVYLIVRTDNYVSQGDVNRLNNAFVMPIHLSPSAADLTVSSASAPAAGALGESISVSWTVNNQGTNDASSNWIDAVYLSSKPTLDDTAVFLDSFSAPPAGSSPLAPGASYTFNQNVVLSGSATGPMYLLFVTNANHNQSEGDATNDVYALPITIAAPDLAPIAASAPATAALGETISVSWSTANQGGAPAPAVWFDAVYISNKNTLDGTATLLGTFYEGAHAGLAAGDSYSDTRNVTLPGSGLGQRYLLFVADDFGDQGEADETNNVYAVPITLTAPDLAAIAASAPATAALGSPITVSWTVENVSSAAAPAPWHDAVYVSSIPTLDGTATLVAQFDESAQAGLAGGASYTDSRSITLPSTAIGQRYLLFVTDSDQGQPETNAANNVYAVPIAITGADLAVSSATAPSIASVGSTFDLSWTIANQGNAAALGNWSAGVYLSNTNVFDGSATFVGSFPVGGNSPLAAGASYAQTASVTIPNAAIGSRFLLIVADPFQQQPESSDFNNTLALPIQLAQVDLAADGVTAPANAVFGEAISVSWTTTNAGSTEINQPWSDRIYLSASSTFDANTAVLLATVSASGQAPLAPGASYTQSALVTPPLNFATTPGVYYLFVLTDGLKQALETNETNNTASQAISLSLPPLPDLAPQNIVVPAAGLTGQGFTVTWTDANNGAIAATGPWVDNVYLSTDQDPAHGILLGSFSYTGSLAPGESATRTQHFNYPGAAGQYYVIVTTNAGGAVQEGPGAANNTAASAATINVSQSPLADLVVAAVIAPPDGSLSGADVSITYTVTNQGTAPTQAPVWYDYVFVSQDPNLSFAGNTDALADQLINNVVVLQERVAPVAATNASYLNPGESYQQTVQVKLPIGASGPWYAYVVADGLGIHFDHRSAAAELDEANNLGRSSASFNVALAPPPDLAVTAVSAPTQAFSGQSTDVSWTVTNTGAGPVSDSEWIWYDQVYLSPSQSLDAGAVLLNTFAHYGVLAAGASYSQHVSVNLPVGLSGTYYIVVKTDAARMVFENGAVDNNVQSAAGVTNVNLTPPPDLVVSSTTAPAAALASHTLQVNYQVSNAGSTVTPNSEWTDSFYLASGAALDPAHDLKLGETTHFGSLAAGESYSSSVNLKLPDGLSGTYRVYVVTDGGAVVFELDKTNNSLGAANVTQISSQPADLVVASAGAPPSANANQAIPVTWTVANQGSGDTAVGDWVDIVYAGLGPTLDASRIFLGAFPHHGLLSAGASYSQTQLVTLPAGFSGQYNLFVVADAQVLRTEDPHDPATGPNGSVYEGANEGNNVAAALAVTVSPRLADLTVAQVTAPASVETGSVLSVSWQVQNAGADATNVTSWYDDVYLSPTATFNPSTAAYLGSAYHNNPLAAGAGYTASGAFVVPQSLAAGSAFLIVRTDRPSPPAAEAGKVNRVLEASETNNDGASAALTISEAPTPRLVTSAVAGPATAYAGQTIAVDWNVANQGAGTGNVAWRDAVYLSLDQVLDPSADIYLGSLDETGGLAGGANRSLSANFKLPFGIAGSYYLIVAADVNARLYQRIGANDRIAASAQPIDIAFAPPVDLAAGTITVPANAVPGQPITLTYTVHNQGAAALQGDWYDALYLDLGTAWQLADPLLGRVHHVGGAAAGGSYTETLTAPLPGVAPGTYHVILRSDIRNQLPETDEENNLSASLDQVAIDAPALTLGTPASGTLEHGQAIYYKVTVAAGETLQLQLVSQNGAAANELYVSFGTTPSRSQFDQRGDALLSPNQSLTIPSTQAGDYYVLLFGASVAGGPSPFTLAASLIPFSVTAVSPPQVGNAGQATIKIEGARFDRDSTFQLVDGQNHVIQASSVYVQDSSAVYATFDLTGAAVGTYDVQATRADQSTANLSGALTVAAGLGGDLITSQTVPAVVLVDRDSVLQVNVANAGDADVIAPLIFVVSPSNTPIGLTPDDLRADRNVFFLAASPSGPAGVLRPGEQLSAPVYFHAPSVAGAPNSFQYVAVTADNAEPLDWSQIESWIDPGKMQFAGWPAAWANLQQRIGSTWGDLVRLLARNATLIPQSVGRATDPIALLDFEVQKAIADVGASLAGTLHLSDPAVAIGGRTIYAIDAASGAQYATRTWNDGSFLFDSIPPGSYTFEAAGLVLAPHPATTVGQDQVVTGVTLNGAAGGEIAGRVTDQSTSLPIDSATVRAVNQADGSVYFATSGADGGYVLSGLPAGVYDVIADADGYARQILAGVDLTGANAIRSFSLGGGAALIGSANLLPGGPGNGVLTVTAQPVGNSDPNQVYSATSASLFFVLGGLPAGAYDVSVSLAGYLTQTFAGLSVPAGGSANLGSLNLVPAAMISGSFSSTDLQTPIADAVIAAYQGAALMATTKTDASGNFTFINLAAGTYDFQILGSTAFVQAPSVTVAAGEQIVGVDITAQPGGTISGSLTNSQNSQPLGGVPVLLLSPSGDISHAVTDAAGAFVFAGLGLGTYQVYLPISGANASQQVAVASLDGAPVAANLQLSVAAVVFGQLKTAAGAPIVDGNVTLLQSGQPVAVASTDAQGNYKLLLVQPGAFDLIATSPAATFEAVVAVTAQSGDNLQHDFIAGDGAIQLTLSSSQSVAGAAVQLVLVEAGVSVIVAQATADANGMVTFTNLVPGTYLINAQSGDQYAGQTSAVVTAGASASAALNLVQTALLSGVVTDGASNPLAGVSVTLQSTIDPSLSFSVVTDDSGAYAIGNVPAGAYDLIAFTDGYLAQVVASLAVSGVVQQDLTLTASATLIDGRLVDGENRPITSGLVEVFDAAGRLIAVAGVNPDGTFQVTSAAGAALTLVVFAQGYASATPQTLDAAPGSTVHVGDVVLQPFAVDPNVPQGAAPATNGYSQPLVDPVAYFLEVQNKVNAIEARVKEDHTQIDPPDCPDEEGAYQRAVNAQKALNRQVKDIKDQIFGIRLQAINADVQAGADLAAIIGKAELVGAAAYALSRAVAAMEAVAYAPWVLRGGATMNWAPVVSLLKAAFNVSSVINAASAVVKASQALSAASSPGDIASVNQQTTAAVSSVSSAIATLLATSATFAAPAPLRPYFGGIKAAVAGLAAAAAQLFQDPFAKSVAEATKLQAELNELKNMEKQYQRLKSEFKQALDDYHSQQANGDNKCDDDDHHDSKPPAKPSRQPQPPNNSNPQSPRDPNEIIGPAGFGDQHFVPASQPLAYQILFENQPTAGLPAQEVTVTQTLDPNLDPRSFRLGEFGWGGMRFSPPPNSAYYQTTIDATATLGFVVQVTATIDVRTGTATWNFLTIDPATGEKPVDFTKGFLPPDADGVIGQGFVSYTVAADAAVQTGDVVYAQATIVFDTQPPLDTAPIFNTLDAGDSLASQIDPLPAVQGVSQFAISWSPSNQPGAASAVASYSIYVSDNGGPFTPLLLDTTATQALFSGQKGHTYAFYSLASDNAGNRQDPASAVVVATTVGDVVQSSTGLTIALVEGQSFSGAVATFTGSDPDGAATDFSAMIDWGDGSPLAAGTISGSPSTGYTISGVHAYSDPGDGLPLRVIITDQGAVQITVVGRADVSNAPLTAVPITIVGIEGASFSGAVAEFTDADAQGAVGDYTATIDWGDGSPLTQGEIAINPAGGFLVVGAHAYARFGSRPVTVIISDDGGGTATADSTASVADAPLTASAATIHATEGATFDGTVAFFSDANPNGAIGDFTAAIDWGDGSPTSAGVIAVNPGGGFLVAGSHAYARFGSWQVTVTISSNGGSTATASGSADVADAPLSAAGATISVTEGATFSGAVATFIDANPAGVAGDYTAVIDWGDGTSSAGTIAAGAGGFTVNGSHVYADESVHLPLRVAISSAGGAGATVVGLADVADAPLHIAAVPISIPPGNVVDRLLLATFVDTGGTEPVGHYAAVIDWGDGSPNDAGEIQFSGGVFQIYGSHAYAASGTFTIGVTVRDAGGATDALTEQASIELTSHQRYVAAVYQDVLGRLPDPTGLDFWTRLLDAGAPISSVAAAIAHSNEYYANFVIKPAYLALLGRTADESGVAYWTARMHAGLTDQQLEAYLVSSDEFFHNAGGTNSAWIDAVYQLLLGRQADPSGEAYWSAQLAAGHARQQIALQIADSAENNTQLINQDYFHYLGRETDPDGLAYWLAQFNAGKTNEDVIAGFTGSEEYYKQHTS